MFFDEFYLNSIGKFLSSHHRLYFPNILTGLIFILLYFLAVKRSLGFREIKNAFLNKEIWKHPSTRVDVYYLFGNAALSAAFYFFMSAYLVSDVSVVSEILIWLRENVGDIKPVSSNLLFAQIFFTLSSFVILDFARYLQHYFMHKSSFLWRFHRVHHEAEVLTPLTITRVHPVEVVYVKLFLFSANILSATLFIYLFSMPLTGIDILGVNALGFIFNSLSANIRHSHLYLGFGYFENFFVSPAQHQIHHSSAYEHRDTNLGVCFSFWDKLFGTYLASSEVKTPLKYGISS